MTEHIVHRFDDELRHLHAQVLAMGELALEQTKAALALAVGGDAASADTLAAKEQQVNTFELQIDEAAIALIARRGPMASDLRTVMALSKMTTDLERIGDEAMRLTELAGNWSGDGSLLDDFRQEADWARELMQRAVGILASLDADAAFDMEERQAQLVEPFRTSIAQLVSLQAHESAGDAVLHALAVRCIERIGDHACNLCEHVVYLGRGEDVRHQSSGAH